MAVVDAHAVLSPTYNIGFIYTDAGIGSCQPQQDRKRRLDFTCKTPKATKGKFAYDRKEEMLL